MCATSIFFLIYSQDHKFRLMYNIYSDTIFERLPRYEGTCAPQAPN